MTFREYKPSDEAQLREIHSQIGYDFEFPNLDESQFVSVWVAEDAGRVVCCVAARKVVEVAALVDAEYATPAARLEILARLQGKGALHLRGQGFAEMQCFVKDSVRGFARRLVRNMGWHRSAGGECFVRSLR